MTAVEQMTVDDPRAARAFATARPRAILFALMQSEQSLQGLTTLGLSLSLLHYHVARLVALGLVRVAGHRSRAGPPVAIYAAAARSFLVPAHLAAPPGAAQAGELHAALERARLRLPGRGTVYALDGQRLPRIRQVAPPGPADEGEQWWRLALTEAEAAALARDIRALVAGYRTAGPRPRTYLCHFAIGRS